MFNYKTDGWVKNLVLESSDVKSNYNGDSLVVAGLILNAANTRVEQVGIVDGIISALSFRMGYMGGLIGSGTNVAIKDSYVQANLTGYRLGGLAYSLTDSTVENSYFAGGVSASNKNGLVHLVTTTNVSNSYWDSTLSGITSTNGGGIPLTTTQFQNYTTTKTLPGFDFDNVWQIKI